MAEIMSDAIHVLHALIAAPVAWQAPEELAEALERGLEETLDLLADLDRDGLVDTWEREEGLVVTLSALSAERLRVRIVEFGTDETPRWGRVDEPEPPRFAARHLCTKSTSATLSFVVDPNPTAEEAAEQADRGALPAPGSETDTPTEDKSDNLPRPTSLLGLSFTPWPGPLLPIGTECPVCGGLPLPLNAYCLLCDGWGGQSLLEPMRPPSAPPAAAPEQPVEALSEREILRLEAAESDALRDRRRAKRRRRRDQAAGPAPFPPERGASPSQRQPESRPATIDLGLAGPPKGCPPRGGGASSSAASRSSRPSGRRRSPAR